MKNTFKKLFEIHFIIIITILGYSTALMYEKGYSEYFQYPSELVSIDVNSLFFGILTTFLIACMLMTVVLMFSTFESIVNSAQKNKILYIVIATAVIVLFSSKTAALFTASSMVDFYSFTIDNKKYAIIKISGNNIITKEIINNELSQNSTYFKDEKINGLNLELINLNKLKEE